MWHIRGASYMTDKNRPLSPHLQVYRPQLTAVLSIFHRLSGITLAGGAAMLACWLLTAAAGPEYYQWSGWFLSSWIGIGLLVIWSWTLFYHLSNGIRHLFWDIGLGFSLKATYASGIAVIISSVLLTAISWGLGISMYCLR